MGWGQSAPRGSWRGCGEEGGSAVPSVENRVTEWESSAEAAPHLYLVPVWKLGTLCGSGEGFLLQPHSRMDAPVGPQREPLWGVNSIQMQACPEWNREWGPDVGRR